MVEIGDNNMSGPVEKKKYHVLLGCTGSVASIKVPDIIKTLMESKREIEVQVVTTERACHFFNKEALGVKVHTDEDEWQMWQKRGDPVLHIELRRWADLMIIAPLDANTLAKISAGLCDNLLTCIVRAWDLERPLLFAPAMNTYMWDHPLTSEHISSLQKLGYKEIPCIEKTLMCGDKGLGAMAEVPTLVSAVEEMLTKDKL